MKKPQTVLPKQETTRNSRTEKVKDFLSSLGQDSGDIEAVRLTLRDKCKSDFWFFQCHVYGNADTLTPLHMDMCERWQKRINKRFSLWLLPRSHLKTSCFTEAGTLWELLSDPHLRFLITNAKLENAIDILANIRSCVESNEIFRWLFPEYCPDLASKTLKDRCKWLTHRLDFPCSMRAGKKEGNIEVMSVGASLVSKHYDRMIFDDPVNDENTTTKQYRDKVDRWYKNALQLRHDANSIIRLIGTRWHFDDLYSRRIKEEMDRRKKQKESGEPIIPRYFIYHRQVVERVEAGGESIVGYDNVQPIWPERFNKQAINEIREENGSYIFSCQYMNNPLPDEDAIFKHTDIREIPSWEIPAENIVTNISCDIAVEETEKGDFWVLTVAQFDELGKMYVREIIRDKLLTSTFLAHLAGLVTKWKPLKVSIEATAFQKTLNKTYREWAIKNGINIPWVEIERGKSSKFKRILSFQPRVERGDFYIEEGIKNSEWLVEEMTTYPQSVNDDILDTLVDLESLFFSAPSSQSFNISKNTYDGVWGSLDSEGEDFTESRMDCDVIQG